MRVVPPLPKKSKDDLRLPHLCDPMADIFNPDCSDWLSCDDSKPRPLKRRRLKTKRKQGSLAHHLEPCPAPEQDNDIHPAEEQGDDFCPAATQGKASHPAAKQGNDSTHPIAKQGVKPRPVASLPMSITRQLPSTPFIHCSGMTSVRQWTLGLWRQLVLPWSPYPLTTCLNSMRSSANIGMPTGMPRLSSSIWKRRCLLTSDIGLDSGHGT